MEVAFRNPLKVPLLLSDLSLLWKFQPKDASGKDIEKVKERVSYCRYHDAPDFRCYHSVHLRYKPKV